MKTIPVAALLCCLCFIACEEMDQIKDKMSNPNNKTLSFNTIPVTYPDTYADSSVVDNYHGKQVSDPFRWLEDDHASQTKEWTKAQNQVTFSYLDKIPFRKTISKRLEEMWNYERYNAPFKKGEYYYYFKNDGLQNQALLYRLKNWEEEAQVVLDPNQFSKDGTSSLGEYSFSKDGKYLAYQVSEGGSDWRSIRIKNLETGELLPESIDWVKFSNISWSDNGFFYCRYPAPTEQDKLSAQNQFHQVYYHLLGTAQSDDDLVFADRSKPNRGFSTFTTSDERFLLLQESTSGHALYFKDLKASKNDFTPIYEKFDADFIPIDNIDDQLLILTNYKANNN